MNRRNEDSQMSDDEFNGLMRQLHRSKRRKCIATLMAGNDAQCFTTAQYKALMFKDLAKENYPRSTVMTHPYWHDNARKQIADEGFTEVKPEVWAKP